MKIVFKFRVYFEEQTEVERIIDVRANQTFQDFYDIILKSIKFKPDTPCSFFMSTQNWRKGKEISNLPETGALKLTETRLNSLVIDPSQRIILEMYGNPVWEMYIEMVRILKADDEEMFPRLVKELGTPPKQYVLKQGAPTNEFEQMVDDLLEPDVPEDLDDMGLDHEFDQ
jgi:hypothetical protein